MVKYNIQKNPRSFPYYLIILSSIKINSEINYERQIDKILD